jgi:DnaK suppressor protein
MEASKLPVFKARLHEIRTSLVGDVEKVIKSSQKDMSAPAPDITDGAAQAYNLQLMLELGEQDWQKLKKVDDALNKIKNGSYGTCSECEQPIPEARLEVVPFAEYCVNCMNEIENEAQSNP